MDGDFYELKQKVVREIKIRLDSLDVNEDSFDYAVLLYGLSLIEEPPAYENFIKTINQWINGTESGSQNKHLAALSIAIFIESSTKKKAEEKVKEIIKRGLDSTNTKMNIFNIPEQTYFLSLNPEILEENKVTVRQVISKNLEGTIKRKSLFSAALLNLGETISLNMDVREIKIFEDVLYPLWLIEDTEISNKIEPSILWKRFFDVLPQVSISSIDTSENILSSLDLVLLLKAVLKETKNPNPNMLFDLYPLEEEIRNVALPNFKNKRYSEAVFEVTKKLNEKIQTKTGIYNISEADLAHQAMTMKNKKPGDIIIKFNEFLNEESGQNEQDGLTLLSRGIFKAFRNPKGHKPNDHPLVLIDPYDALCQIILMDYIWKRVDSACIKKTNS